MVTYDYILWKSMLNRINSSNTKYELSRIYINSLYKSYSQVASPCRGRNTRILNHLKSYDRGGGLQNFCYNNNSYNEYKSYRYFFKIRNQRNNRSFYTSQNLFSKSNIVKASSSYHHMDFENDQQAPPSTSSNATKSNHRTTTNTNIPNIRMNVNGKSKISTLSQSENIEVSEFYARNEIANHDHEENHNNHNSHYDHHHFYESGSFLTDSIEDEEFNTADEQNNRLNLHHGNDETYTSKYFEIPLSEIQEFLDRKYLMYKESITHVMVKECPFCDKPTGGKLDNLYKLYIRKAGGVWFCHRCQLSGSWFDFKRRMNGNQEFLSSAALDATKNRLEAPHYHHYDNHNGGHHNNNGNTSVTSASASTPRISVSSNSSQKFSNNMNGIHITSNETKKKHNILKK